MKWQGSTKDPGNRPLTGSLRGESLPRCVDLNSVFFEFTGGSTARNMTKPGSNKAGGCIT